MPAEIGIKSPDVPLVAALDEVLGNRIVDGIRDTGRLPIAALVTQIKADPQMADYLSGYDVSYATVTQLNADLAWAAGSIARVFGTGSGIYKKSGASGAGSWTKIGELPAEEINAANIAAAIVGAPGKTTPVAADTVPIIDSEASNGLAEVTWADFKAAVTADVNADLAAEENARIAADALKTSFEDINNSIGDGLDLIGSHAGGTSFALSTGYGGTAAGFDAGTDVAAGQILDAIGVNVALPTDAEALHFTLYSRSSSDGSPDATPGQVSDVTIYDAEVDLADMGIVAVNRLQHAIFRLPSPILIKAGLTYILAVEALDGDGDPVAMGFAYAAASGYPQRRKGFYKATPGAGWTNLGGSNAIVWQAYRARLATDLAAGGVLAPSFERILSPIASRGGNTSTYTLAFGLTNWSVGMLAGTDIAVGSVIRWFGMTIHPHATTAVVFGKLWKRPTGSASLQSRPGAAGDILLATKAATLAELGLSSSFGRAAFETDGPITIEAGFVYLIELDCVNASGTSVAFGVLHTSIVYSAQYRRGFYGAAGNIVSGNTIGFEFGDFAYSPRLTDSSDELSDRVVDCSASAAGLVVSVSASSRLARRGFLLPFGGNVTMTEPTTGNLVGEAVSLSFSNASIGMLDHANVTVTEVRDASTLAVLAEGGDYVVHHDLGRVMRFAAGADRPVLVDYDWSDTRYDTIYLDAETLVLGKAEGTEAARDAFERMPAIGGPSRIDLFSARVTASEVELIPTWDLDSSGLRRGLHAELERQKTANRRHLRPVLQKLAAGDPITIAGYGDSIVALFGVSASATEPNGTTRDRADAFAGLGADLVTELPKHDQGDGAGPIHVKVSQVWQLIAAMEAASSSVITYLNMGIGGSTTANTTNNGTHAARLAALTGSAADLVLFHFGTNEFNSAATEANTVTMIDACKAVGKCVAVLGAPRPGVNPYRGNDAGWSFTMRALDRAADYRKVAFVDYRAIYADENAGALRMSKRDFTPEIMSNHPGLREHAIAGMLIDRMILDD